MGRVAMALVFGYFCINAAIWSVSMLGILPLYARDPITTPDEISTWFALDVFTLATGVVGGTAIGILAFITKAYTWSTGVLICWIVGLLLRPLQAIFIGLPKLIEGIVPPEISWVTSIISGFAAFILFILFVEIIGGKDIF